MKGFSNQNLIGTWLLAPLMAAAYPVLSLFVQNIDEVILSDVGISLVLVSILSITLAFFFRTIFSCVHRASIASALFTLWFFAFTAFLFLGEQLLHIFHFSHFAILATLSVFWTLAFFALFAFLKWYPCNNDKIAAASKLVRSICIILVGVTCLQGAFAFSTQVPKQAASQSPETSSDLSLKQPENLHELRSQHLSRDIYYLVFDRYADTATLRDHYGFDNSEFYAELKKRGFHVYDNARASYPKTLLSMSSTLNMCYLPDKFGAFSDFSGILQEHTVGKWFVDGGYHYYHIGCSFGPLQSNRLAQTVVSTSFPASEFSRTLLRMTPVGRVLGHSMKYREILGQFEALSTVAKDEKTTFAYAHFLTPHHPYVFARDGSLRKLLERFPVGAKEPYIDQLISLNAMILDMLDEILQSSSKTPIIILQADEGPYLASTDDSLSRIEKIIKRTGILSAILIPDEEIAEKLPSELAPVNTFRFLFREYLQAPIDLLPTRIFWWEGEPYGKSTEGMDVTEELKQFDGTVSGRQQN